MANLDFDDLMTLAAEPSSDARRRLLRGLTDLFLAEAKTATHDECETFGDLARKISQEVDVASRAELSERIAIVDETPHNLVAQLAQDDAIDVAAPILEHSTVLTDDDLVAITEAEGEDHMLAISKRATLSEIVTDRLVQHGTTPVLRTVSGNHGARFSAKGANMLVERAKGDRTIIGNLYERQDVPKAAAKSVERIVFNDSELGNALRKRRVKRLTESLAATFTQLSGMEPREIAEIIQRGKPDMIAIIARAVDFDRGDLRLVLEDRLERSSESGAILHQTLEKFDAMPQENARRVATFLKVRKAVA
ncbi:MAG: DUF2336 domain-containing protein [Pseudomonadota bacterium]